MAAILPRSRSVFRTRTLYVCPHCRHYASPSPSASTPPAPPLLLKLRSDLKTAMKEKDKSRLNVLRALLAEVTNAAKTAKPINSDLQLLSLLRKRASAAKTASAEFKAAGREDLVENEEAQAAIMEGYAGGVETMGEEEVKQAVEQVVEEIRGAAPAGGKVGAGEVLKRLFAPGGKLDGKPVEKSMAARLAKEVLA